MIGNRVNYDGTPLDAPFLFPEVLRVIHGVFYLLVYSLTLQTFSHLQWTHMGWGIIPSTIVISFFLLGIDEIGIQVRLY